jgi:hypothetical protein
MVTYDLRVSGASSVFIETAAFTVEYVKASKEVRKNLIVSAAEDPSSKKKVF